MLIENTFLEPQMWSVEKIFCSSHKFENIFNEFLGPTNVDCKSQDIKGYAWTFKNIFFFKKQMLEGNICLVSMIQNRGMLKNILFKDYTSHKLAFFKKNFQ